jgi:hypothetical protein
MRDYARRGKKKSSIDNLFDGRGAGHLAGHRDKRRAQPERVDRVAAETALPGNRHRLGASNDNRDEEKETRRSELTPTQEATKSVFALAFVFVLIFVCAVVLVMLAPFDPSDLFMSFTAGVIVAWLAARLMLRGIEITVDTLGEVTAHPVLFLSAFVGLIGLLLGLEFVPAEYPVEAKVVIVFASVALYAAIPFVLWALHYWMRRGWDWTSDLLRPSAEKAAAHIKAVPVQAKNVHLATVARVSRIPLMAKALAGCVVAVVFGTVALLALPSLIVSQASEAPRSQARAIAPRPLRPRIETPVQAHPRAAVAPATIISEPEPPILQPVAVVPPYRSPYLRFFQHHHHQTKSRKHKGIR